MNKNFIEIRNTQGANSDDIAKKDACEQEVKKHIAPKIDWTAKAGCYANGGSATRMPFDCGAKVDSNVSYKVFSHGFCVEKE